MGETRTLNLHFRMPIFRVALVLSNTSPYNRGEQFQIAYLYFLHDTQPEIYHGLKEKAEEENDQTMRRLFRFVEDFKEKRASLPQLKDDDWVAMDLKKPKKK